MYRPAVDTGDGSPGRPSIPGDRRRRMRFGEAGEGQSQPPRGHIRQVDVGRADRLLQKAVDGREVGAGGALRMG
jgi:hypothetical protein